MTGEAPPPGIRIGAELAQGRAQAGLDLAELEERTKVRAKYLRALEEERWEELPSAAYAKGFLRTYANAVGLDAELLVDEFRRQVEAGSSDAGGPLGEQVLEHRRRLGEEPRRFAAGTVALALVSAVAVAVAVLALLGEGDQGDEEPIPAARDANDGKDQEREREPRTGPPGELVRLELRVRKSVEVCLLGAERQELIDGQLLAAGSRDAFAAERFGLRFPAGFDANAVTLELNGKRAKLPRVEGPARFEITPPRRVRQASSTAESCP